MRASKLLKTLTSSKLVRILLLIGIVSGASYFLISKSIAQIQTYTNTLEIGFIGEPRRINPLWSEESQIDDMVSKVIYRSLIKYDETSQPIGDLAQTWTVSEDKKGYSIILKPNQYWQDGTPITAEDVFFTYQLTQTDAYNGPEKNRFKDVFIESPDAITILFTLNQPFSPFIEALTMPIMPKHIWQDMTMHKIQTSKNNLTPIGSTDFKISDLKVAASSNNQDPDRVTEMTIEKLNFTPSDNEFKRILLKFYPDEMSLLDAYNIGEIDRFITTDKLTVNLYELWQNTRVNEIPVQGQLISLFFNLTNKNSPVYAKSFRETFRNSFAENQDGYIVLNSPIPSSHWAYYDTGEFEKIPKDQVTSILQSEWPITLATQSIYPNKKTAQDIVTHFEELGRDIKIENYPATILKQDVLADRKFDVLLAQLKIGQDPDQYSFWHSSQIDLSESGQNASNYSNRKLDKVIEDGRNLTEVEDRKEQYEVFQTQLYEDVPAIFIEHPPLYEVSRINVASEQEQKPIWYLTDYLESVLTK